MPLVVNEVAVGMSLVVSEVAVEMSLVVNEVAVGMTSIRPAALNPWLPWPLPVPEKVTPGAHQSPKDYSLM